MSNSESFFDSIKSWFSTESAEAKQVKDDVARRLDEDLTRREAELTATPAERLDNIQSEIDSSNSSFDEIRAKIDATATEADLDAAEQSDAEQAVDESATDGEPRAQTSDVDTKNDATGPPNTE